MFGESYHSIYGDSPWEIHFGKIFVEALKKGLPTLFLQAEILDLTQCGKLLIIKTNFL